MAASSRRGALRLGLLVGAAVVDIKVLGLHGGERGGVAQSQIAQARKLNIGVWPEARRVSRSSQGGVVRRRRQRVMGEGGRRGRSRLWRVRPRSLRMPSRRVVIVVVLIV